MRLTNIWSSRPPYYDRNPTLKFLTGSRTGTPPLASAPSILYTVPANRSAFIQYGYIDWSRSAAAGVIAKAGIGTLIVPTAGSSGLILQLLSVDNTLDTLHSAYSDMATLMPSGYAVLITSLDNSTGGTVTFEWTFHVLEFDT